MKTSPGGNITFNYYKHILGLAKIKYKVKLPSFDMVAVRFYHDEKGMNGKYNKITYMPAINFFYLINEQNNSEYYKIIGVLELAIGVGAIRRAFNIKSYLNALYFLANGAVNFFRYEMKHTDEGRKFLDIWDSIMMLIGLYGLTKVLINAHSEFIKLNNGYQAWKRKYSKDTTKINPKTKKRIEEIDNFIKELEKSSSKYKNKKQPGYNKRKRDRDYTKRKFDPKNFPDKSKNNKVNNPPDKKKEKEKEIILKEVLLLLLTIN